MHPFLVMTLFIVTTLVGVEFSVSAFVHPAAARLAPEARLRLLSRLAVVLGRVMPVWYPAASVLLCVAAWLGWHTPERPLLLAAAAIWVLASLASVVFLVPLNTRIAAGDADWLRLHQSWDRRHRVRIAALAAGALVFANAVVGRG